MRSHSFNAFLSLCFLLATSGLASPDYGASADVDADDVVTVVVRSTVTTCPIPPTPPPPCSSAASSSGIDRTLTLTSTSTGTTTLTSVATSQSSGSSSASTGGSSSAGSWSSGSSSSAASSTWQITSPGSSTGAASTGTSIATSSPTTSSGVSSSSQSSDYSTFVPSSSSSSCSTDASSTAASSSSSSSSSYTSDVTTSTSSSYSTDVTSTTSSSVPSSDTSGVTTTTSSSSSSSSSSYEPTTTSSSSSTSSSTSWGSTSSTASSTTSVSSGTTWSSSSSTITSSSSSSSFTPSTSSSSTSSSSSSSSSSSYEPTTTSSSSSTSSSTSWGSTSSTASSTTSVSSSTTSSGSSSTISSSSSSTISSSSSSTISSSSSSTISSSSSSATSSSSSSTITSSSSSSSSSTTSTSSSSTSSSSTTSASAPACTDHWLANVQHLGYAPYASSPSTYKVFRNVKDFGAKGDGVTDDTDAINRAISDGGRCAPGTCQGTTTTPAVVYFPPGTYLVSSPIVDYYFTQIYGNPDCMPVIKAGPRFSGPWVLDANQYQPGGAQGWGSTNVFWRQVRNLVIDLTAISPSSSVAGIHWPSSQATSLQNILVKMSTASNTQHYGLYIENGSGGYIGDMVFQGGLEGMRVGNQQFTMRNLTFVGAKTAIKQLWDWGWTYSGITIRDCGVGLDMSNVDKGAIPTAAIVFIDSEIINTPVGIVSALPQGHRSQYGPAQANTLVVENVRLSNVPIAIQGADASTIRAGTSGSDTLNFVQGNTYTPLTGPVFVQGDMVNTTPRPSGLTAGSHFYERSRPQYSGLVASDFVSIRTAGAKGDGVTDDTDAINRAIASATAANKVVFFDFGIYVVTSTVQIPPGARVTGEGLPVILSQGQFFNDMANPKPVVQVGQPGDVGAAVEWSDMVVSTRGQQRGAVLIEWNLASSTPSGMWDVHTRIGGFQGSNLQSAECPKTPDTKVTSANLNQNCIAAFMSMHVTASAANLYSENCWLWVADHDVEDGANNAQITIYAGRGLLVESTAGSIWLWGSGVEHHQLYQYQFAGTRSVFAGQIQSETAYYQPNPDALIPFPVDARYRDPVLAAGDSGWGLRVVDSDDVLIYGAGLYSFFINNNNSCSDETSLTKCQTRVATIEHSKMALYNLNTVGASNMVTVDGVDVAKFDDNRNGFVSTVASLWTF